MKTKKKQHNKSNKKLQKQEPDRLPVWFDYVIYLFLLVLIVLTIVIRSNFIDIPFERDEGDYFYISQVMLDGKTPYVDFYEQKLPGMFYCYAFMTAVFGNTVEGAHTGFMVMNILTLIIIFFIGKSLFNNLSGLIAATFFMFLSLNPQIMGFTTQSEHFIAFFASGGFLAFIFALKRKKWWLYLISGGILTAAVFVKQSGIVFVFMAGITIIYIYYKQKLLWKKLIVDLAVFLGGIVLVSFLFLLQVIIDHAVDDMWYWAFYVANNYIGEISMDQGMDLLKTTFNNMTHHYGLLWFIVFAGLPLLFAIKKFKGYRIFAVILICISLYAVVPGLRFYGHYFLQLTPVFALMSAAAFYGVYQLLKSKMSRLVLQIILLILLFLVCIQQINRNSQYYFHPNHTRLLRDVYGMNPFPEAKVIGDFIKEKTESGDQIAVLGSEPQIYFYTDRRCVSRHHYITFLMGDTLIFPENKHYQQEYINDIETKKPKYMVFFNHPISWLSNPNADQSISKWFNGFASEYYNLVGVADMISSVKTNYVWYDKIKEYKPTGKYIIGVFERKPDN